MIEVSERKEVGSGTVSNEGSLTGGAFGGGIVLDSRGVATDLPGAPALGSFIVGTAAPERDYALVGADISASPMCFHNNVAFFIDYDAQVGQADFTAQTFNGGVRVNF